MTKYLIHDEANGRYLRSFVTSAGTRSGAQWTVNRDDARRYASKGSAETAAMRAWTPDMSLTVEAE